MIGKIKDLVQISVKLDEINTKVDSNVEKVERHSTVLKDYKEEVSCLRGEFIGTAKDMKSALEGAPQLILEMENVNKDMKNELYELKKLKADMKSTVVSELMEVFREELQKQTRQLDCDVKSYNELKSELGKITDQLSGLHGEMDKFRKISSQIKTADFDLAKHAREVTKADGEKLKLMREVERLQMLISKERRRQR
ncbi:hypothetical protein ACFL0V_04950 [Nanoarchaeota archaeon]